MNNLRKFINILSENPQEIRQAIDKRVQTIPDEGDLKDILKFTNKYSIKKDVEQFSSIRDYKGLVSSIFLEALANADFSDADVKKFLNKLSKDGILDEKKLLTPRKLHSYAELIDKEFQPMFDAIKLDIFEKIAGKIGEKGDVGKGEYMLDIISTVVNRRGAPGDLDIGGTKVELKAGQNGRLGPAGSQAIVGRFAREFAPAIQKLQPNKQVPTDNENISAIFNPKLNMSAFTEFFDGNAKAIKSALTLLLQMHYPSVNVNAMVQAVLGPNGIIDGNELKKQMLKTSFDVYKAEKEFDGVIVMDSGVTGFLYVNSGDDLAAVADMLSVSFPSWTDTQGNCMKVTISGTALKTAGKAAGVIATPASKSAKAPKAPVDAPADAAPVPSATPYPENNAQRKALEDKAFAFAKNFAAQRGVTDEDTISQIAFYAIDQIESGVPPETIKTMLPKLIPALQPAAQQASATAAQQPPKDVGRPRRA